MTSAAAATAARADHCAGCRAPCPSEPEAVGWKWKRIYTGGHAWSCAECWIANHGPQARFLSLTCFEALYGGSAGGGKLLPLTTPIPTPTGWTTMGELRPGDEVLSADGEPTGVTWVSEVDYNPEAWELVFDDGVSLLADSGHQWLTLTDAERLALVHLDDTWRAERRARRPRRRGGRKSALFSATIAARNATRAAARRAELKPPGSPRGTTRTTLEIVQTLRVGKAQRANHCVVNPSPLALPKATLPVDPYVLGAWLGDGTTIAGQISGLDEEVFASIAAAGYVVTRHRCPKTRGVLGLAKDLRRAGVLGNKHVPIAYLRASVEQRLALLQGLCDTDGHATADKGSIEFTTTSQALRDGVVELLATLGIKPSVREGRATLRGRDISAKWRIQFWTALPCFRIERKLARQKRSGFRGLHDRRYIIAARRVDAVPMRCIAVDAPSRTYLAGRAMVPTHNSDSLLVDAIRYVGRGYGPNYMALLLRREFPDLALSLIPRSQAIYPKHGGKYNKVDKVWTFPGGETVHFGHCQRDTDVHRYQGAAFQFIGFDELTTFTEHQYKYLISRLRSAHSIPCRMRSATNPGGDGHEWVFRRFGPWLDPEAKTKAAPGQVLYFVRDGDVERVVDKGTPRSIGRTFVPAVLADNPYLAEDGAYERGLDELDLVSREQLKHGNWLIKPAPGLYFKKHYFEIVDAAPAEGLRIRYWDRAATEPSADSPDPDWTAGVRMMRARDGIFYIEDVARDRLTPGAVEKLVKQTAELDGVPITVGLEQDPGQAGKFEVATYIRALAGFNVRAYPVTKDKLTRAKPLSAQAEAGNVKLVRGPWNKAFIDELQQFPASGKGIHDDQVDGASGAFTVLTMAGARAEAQSGGRPKSSRQAGRRGNPMRPDQQLPLPQDDRARRDEERIR